MKDKEPIEDLFSSRGFKLSIIMPILLGIVAHLIFFGVPTTFDFCTTGSCLNVWYKYNQVPLLIAGLSIPITAMYIAHHRSKHQVRLYETQQFENRQSLYLSSFKQFDEAYLIFLKEQREKNGSGSDIFPASSRQLFSLIIDKDENSIMRYSEALKNLISNLRSANISLTLDLTEDDFNNLVAMLDQSMRDGFIYYEYLIMVGISLDKLLIRFSDLTHFIFDQINFIFQENHSHFNAFVWEESLDYAGYDPEMDIIKHFVR